MRQYFAAGAIMLFACICPKPSFAQEPEPHAPPALSWSVTAKSVGNARTGVTVSKLRKALSGLKMKRETGPDGIALIGVWKGGKELMTLYAGEDDPGKPIRANAVVVQIEALDPRFRTKRGVHPGMLLSKVVEKYGKLLKIERSEIEGLEYAAFVKQEPGIELEVGANGGTAGSYPRGKDSAPASTARFTPDAKIVGIIVRSGKP